MNPIKYLRKQFEEPALSEDNELLIEIITKLCDDPNTEFRMSPTEKYYGINDKLKYYVVACEDYVKITNHTFYLTKYGHIKQMTKVIDLIRDRIEKDRDELEEEIFKNEIALLTKISSNITKSKNDTNKQM